MTGIKKSKTNGTSFQDIPEPIESSREVSIILSKLKRKYDLKEERVKLVAQARALRKDIYNYSQAINKLEIEIDTALIKKLKQEG